MADPTPTPYVVSPITYNRVCQVGHALAGMCAVFGPAAVLPYWWRFYGAALMLSWVISKEWVYDMIFETDAGRGPWWEDVLFYLIGLGIALALVMEFGK